MKFGVHLIGVALSALLVVLAAWGAIWPPAIPTGMSESALMEQLQSVRRERETISAQWGSTVEAMAQMSIRPDASAAVAIVAPRPRGRASIRLPATGPWSAKETAERRERQLWIAEELRKRGAE
jgi:hypothetical protein